MGYLKQAYIDHLKVNDLEKDRAELISKKIVDVVDEKPFKLGQPE